MSIFVLPARIGLAICDYRSAVRMTAAENTRQTKSAAGFERMRWFKALWRDMSFADFCEMTAEMTLDELLAQLAELRAKR